MTIYEAAEDSYLLQKCVREHALGRILDVGTGSGIQALTAIEYPNVREVVAIDQDAEAVTQLQQKIKQERLRKIKALQSDLFQQVQGSFNLIIFNPPYLPQDKGITDQTLYGGKKGWEISERFFSQASKHLFPDGSILFLFSSLTNKSKIEEIIRNNLLQFTEIAKEKLAFEELYVYKIEKTPLLRELEGKGIEDIHYFAHGKRGIIYTGLFDQSIRIKKFIPSKRTIKVAIKVKKPESKALNSIANEAACLQKLNLHHLGPVFLFQGESYLVYQFVEGEFIIDWLEQHDAEAIKSTLIQILKQCSLLDKLKLEKQEMHHPQKHILLEREIPVLLDFERCKTTTQPKNVTQFVEFICRENELLTKKGIALHRTALQEQAKRYKKDYSTEEFATIVKLLQ